MSNIYLNNKLLNLSPSSLITKGGEAEIYKHNNRALKIFKLESHPDFQGNTETDKRNREGAKYRLNEYQTKLPNFPKINNNQIIIPLSFIKDNKGIIIGYEMQLIDNSEMISVFKSQSFRNKNNLNNNFIINSFVQIFKLVEYLNKLNVIIGDFKDLNILFKNQIIYFIDTDSYQFNKYLCHSFSLRFVDPDLCREDKKEGIPVLNQPYTKESDWYAFNVLLFQSLLFVHPYEGVYSKINPELRPMYRISVYHKDVIYPKFAPPIEILPDDLNNHFYNIFQSSNNKSKLFPEKLLNNIVWNKCLTCGIEYSKSVCPKCIPIQTKHPVIITQTISGNIKETKIFRANGNILFASIQNDELLYLYDEGGKLKREGNRYISDTLYQNIKYRIHKEFTILGQGQQLLLINDNNKLFLNCSIFNNYSSFDINSKYIISCNNGIITKTDINDKIWNNYNNYVIGNCIENQTQIWIGETFGFGFYQAGQITIYFTFTEYRNSVNDSIKISSIKGQLLDSCCFFSNNMVWFFMIIEENGITINHCYVIDKYGKILSTYIEKQGGGNWLFNIRGKCTIGDNKLLIATDNGLIRIDVDNNKLIQTREFKGTDKYVNSMSHLFLSQKGGIYVINQRDIVYLEIR